MYMAQTPRSSDGCVRTWLRRRGSGIHSAARTKPMSHGHSAARGGRWPGGERGAEKARRRARSREGSEASKEQRTSDEGRRRSEGDGGGGSASCRARHDADNSKKRAKGPRRQAGGYSPASRRGAALPGLRSEERATREGGAFRRPGGEREEQSSVGRVMMAVTARGGEP